MKDLNQHKKITVLIDADNAQCSKLKYILDEISAHGHIVIKRAYGDWSNECLKNWKKELNELAIQPIQQFAYTVGKNATDASMIIDAMDLLYSGDLDAFALVSSDSDFTKLASRLKESEIFVFGVGETKTPISFRNACDDFILTENLGQESTSPDDTEEHPPQKLSKQEKQLVHLLSVGWKQYQDDDGWAKISAVGGFIKRSKPDFDPRTYGATKITDIIMKLDSIFTVSKFKGKNGGFIVAYKPVTRI